VRIDDYLPKRIVRVNGLLDIDSKVAEQLDHSGDSKRMHTILRLFEAQ